MRTMRTREEIRLRRREAVARTLYTVLLILAVLWLLSMPGNAAWECTLEGVSTDRAVTGAVVWGAALMGLIVKIDRQEGRNWARRRGSAISGSGCASAARRGARRGDAASAASRRTAHTARAAARRHGGEQKSAE